MIGHYLKQRHILIFLLIVFIGCNGLPRRINYVNPKDFEHTIEGKSIGLFTLTNSKGVACQITNYGGRVVSLFLRDRFGDFDDVVMGYPDLQHYINSPESYFGATIGRYGNRIANGRFSIGDQEYTLNKNDGENHLHGGIKGFNQVIWDVKQLTTNSLELAYYSPDGEEGYPGNVSIEILFTLTEESALKIEYKATTDQITPINLTHHSYFNLRGVGNGDIFDHMMQINAASYTPVNEDLIPTGEILPVVGTPFDFNKLKLIGKDIDADDPQLIYGKGYDHNFVIDGTGLRKAAKVIDYHSGRTMEVWTDEPGLQFYSGNFLNSMEVGKEELRYHRRGALCLETQHFPDSPNHSNFPTTLVRPGQIYTSTCIYKFGLVSAND